jgi:DNA-binding protein H-NS
MVRYYQGQKMTDKKVDLSGLTTAQLKKLLADGAVLLKRQESGAAALAECVAEVRKLAASRRVSLSVLAAALARPAPGVVAAVTAEVPEVKRRAPAAVKYAKDGKTWTGRGYQPQWVKDHLAVGGKLDDLKA